ncbi:BON domain-containing protein [Oryzifoliimicrobium ureilyticus]|uniref:BON domain-containing protein n=1 Tax=Oryzifoliimicrobium ureilyticus TaxID=3113724 RepID=UPI003F67FE72
MMNGKTTREEDYRDYEERDVSEGWPYADEGTSRDGSANNKPYGNGVNFDAESNPGFRTETVDEQGREPGLRDSLTPEAINREDADDLEARVTERLEEVEDLDIDSIDVHADGHTITLEGSVDTLAISRKAELVALGTKGVKHVRNRLETIGVDAHIPNED